MSAAQTPEERQRSELRAEVMQEVHNEYQDRLRTNRERCLEYLDNLNHFLIIKGAEKNSDNVAYYHSRGAKKGTWEINNHHLTRAINLFLNEDGTLIAMNTNQIREIAKKFILTRDNLKVELSKFNRFSISCRSTQADSAVDHPLDILINVSNGILVYSVSSGLVNLKNHNKKYMYLSKLNISWTENTYSTQRFDTILENIIPDARERELYLIYLGYTLIPNFDWEIALCLFGNGRNGKSSLIASWASVFEHAQPNDLGNLTGTFGKALIYNSDLIWAKIESTDHTKPDMAILKATTSGEPQEINIKNITQFNAIIAGKMMITANYLPILKDTSDFRRLLILRTPNKITRPDPEIKKFLTSKTAKNILFSLAISKLPTFFTDITDLIIETELKSRAAFDKLYDPFEAFADTMLSFEHDDNEMKFDEILPTTEITDLWNAYAITHHHDEKSAKQVGRAINRTFNIKAARYGRIRGFYGLTIVDEDDETA